MDEVDEQGRRLPPLAGDEAATVLGYLDYQRATFEWKCSGLDADQLRVAHPPSSMTLGGMLKHLALVEDGWFGRCLRGLEYDEPWRAVDWEADRDWEWHSAASDTPEELWSLWRRAVARSRERIAASLDEGGMGAVALRTDQGEPPSLRWILCHLIEEYARHNGHADLIRESIDGATGE